MQHRLHGGLAMGWGRWTLIACGLLLLCFLLLMCRSAMAEPSSDAAGVPYSSSLHPMISAAARPALRESLRPQWPDLALYGGIATYRTLDYLSTRRALARGAQEQVLPQWVVNSHPTFIAFEGLATSIEVSSSVWLIRRGHRRMARAMNLFSIGLGTKAVVNNYAQP